MMAKPLADGSETRELSTGCGPGWWGGGRLWPLLPLVLVGIVLAVVVLGLTLGASEGSWTSAPYLWPLFPFGFFLVIGIVLVARRFLWWGAWWGRPWHGSVDASAEEIARRRYARGEISREQLREVVGELEATRRGRPRNPET